MKPHTTLRLHLKYRLFIIAVLAICFALTTFNAFAQEEKDVMLERIYKKLEQYQREASIDGFGAMSGLWKSVDPETADNPVRQITHYNDILLYFIVDRATGDLALRGYTEKENGEWKGWWKVACRDCCPGESWWDKAVLQAGVGGGISIRVSTFKMDPNTCKLTTTPDIIDLKLNLMQTLKFKEYLPGKLIHVVAAPAVGNQPAQYKASVTLQWNVTGLGVSYVQLAMVGKMLVNNSRLLNGQYEFLTDRSGEYRFLFICYNSKNQFLHLEIKSISIPRIPGIN